MGTQITKIEMPTLNNRMEKYELYLILKKHAAMCGKEVNFCSYDIKHKSKKFFIDAIQTWVNQYNNNIDKANETARRKEYLQTPEGKAKLAEIEKQFQIWHEQWERFNNDFKNQLSAIFSRANIDHIKIVKISDNGFNLYHEDCTRADWYALSFSYNRSWYEEPSKVVVQTTSFGSFNPNEDKDLANYFILQGQIATKAEIFNEITTLYDTRNEFSNAMTIKYDQLDKQKNSL